MHYRTSRTLLALVSGITLVYLAAVLVISLGLAFWVAVVDPVFLGLPSALAQPLIAGLAGVSGSTFRAIWSCADRIANGWEIGTLKLPDAARPEKFHMRLVPGYVARPFLGAWVGLILYGGLKGGSLFLAAERVELNPLALVFVSGVAGLFAKRFAESLAQRVP